MKNIQIISASAGTGKTYQLAQVLFDRICGGVQPESIIATTFTTKAADELKSRIRAGLIRKGRADAAQRLDAALIGTVNSVCHRLVRDHAFQLGLSPEVGVLDESMAKNVLKQVIADVATREQMEELDGLNAALSEISWQENVQAIVNLARTNNIGPVALAGCEDRSVEQFLGILPERGSAEGIEAKLRSALETFMVEVEEDGVKKTAAAVKLAKSVLVKIAAGSPPAWQAWFKLSGLAPAKKQDDVAEPVRAAAEAHGQHPGLHEQCERVIRLIFQLAVKALSTYQQHKAEMGALDFADQEVYALKLLNDESVVEQLRGRVSLVLVDEFQDTSPIQLAIFLKLAELVDESVWVGDQKQSIYGFRGTDPALMDAAIKSIEASGGEPKILKESWRSRPALVDVSSDIFAKAFAGVGIPEERVRIRAAADLGAEPGGLGPVMETWSCNPGRKKFDALGVAAGVRDLLEDETVKVRDRVTGQTRAVRPDDVAVLCATNRQCDAIAESLARAGVPAHRERTGLLMTPEARLVIAGLRYFVDDHDALAVAELARALTYPEDGSGLLDALIAKPYAGEFHDMCILQSIRNDRQDNPAAGAVAVLDMVFDAVQARETCLRWGDSRNRLDNLDALRMHAVKYAASCETQGVACTPAGLIVSLKTLADDEADTQALLPGADKVTVSTWHGSKGCEWPVVVLCALEDDKERSALGVSVASDETGFDMADPLAGRWIRFWPSPYNSATKKASFFQWISAHEASIQVAKDNKRERLRVLYVIWTRAKDRLVLATNKGLLNEGVLSLLADEKEVPLLLGNEQGQLVAVGNVVDARGRALKGLDDVVSVPSPGSWYEYPSPLPGHPPAHVSPSDLEGCGQAQDPESVGKRIPLAGTPDMGAVGNAVHGFLAADRGDMDVESRKKIATGLLTRWDVLSALQPDALLMMSDRLNEWIAQIWPGAKWHREWPVMLKRNDGTIVRGIADLVLELDDAYVLVDHKTFPGNQKQALERVAGYAGQLTAYAEAIGRATDRPVTHMFIHLPVSGLVIPVTVA